MVVFPATQVPVPLHADAARATPLVQLAPAHTVAAPYLRQAPVPLQVPSLPQLVGPWSLHWFFGSAAPAATGTQRPAEPLSRQEKQLPVQDDSQHTPSAQKFEAHSLAAPHAWPSGRLPQEPFTQTLGAMQSALLAHELPQLDPRHLNGEHDVGVGGTHRPVWQVLA